jgi:hypothetical protein
MNGKKTNLRTDTEAVSEVIGIVLIIAIAVTMLTLFQATMVPYWNKQVEATEMKVTYDDMMFLPSDIEDVAIHETPKTCTVQLGAQYPDRMIFRNPGPGAAGTLTVEEAPVPIIVTYNNDSEYTEPYNSVRITYVMSGTINSPKLVYEHGVIITDWGTVNLTTDEQKLIENDNIYIPILNGSSSSRSAIGVESIAIKPYEYLDTLGDIDTVNVTLDTDYPEVWWGLLVDYIDQGMVSVSNQSKKIYINTSVPYLKLPNQTASGPLHAGMISCSVEDPDGGGGGGGGGGGDGTYYFGEGTPTGTIIDITLPNYPSIASPCVKCSFKEQCGHVYKQADEVYVTATFYNAPSKDEVYADVSMLTSCLEYDSKPAFAWTLNMTSPGNIETSIDPPDALDSFPNTFTGTWTVKDLDYLNWKDQIIFVPLWITNETDNQRYVYNVVAIMHN